jgi:hypothetical protein
LVVSFGGWIGVVGCGLGGVGWVVGSMVFEGFSGLAGLGFEGFGDFDVLAVLTVLAVERGVFCVETLGADYAFSTVSTLSAVSASISATLR